MKEDRFTEQTPQYPLVLRDLPNLWNETNRVLGIFIAFNTTIKKYMQNPSSKTLCPKNSRKKGLFINAFFALMFSSSSLQKRKKGRYLLRSFAHCVFVYVIIVIQNCICAFCVSPCFLAVSCKKRREGEIYWGNPRALLFPAICKWPTHEYKMLTKHNKQNKEKFK